MFQWVTSKAVSRGLASRRKFIVYRVFTSLTYPPSSHPKCLPTQYVEAIAGHYG